MIDLRPDFLDTLKRLLAEIVPDCEVRIFGSRYNWTATDASDLDLALVGPGKLHWKTLARLKSALEESSLPYRVDVLDWRAISPDFQKVIKQGYEVIQKPGLGMSSSGWQQTTLDKVSQIICGATPSTSVPEYWSDEIKWVTAKDVSESTGYKIYDTERTISKLGFENCSTRIIPRESTILIARGATMGKSCMLGEDMAINQTCYALVPDIDKINPYFLFYSIKILNNFFQQIAHGAIFNTVIGSGLRGTEISLPPLSTQRRIAGILSALDDKIELNRQTNATLEAIAQAIFKEWFVDFNFPGATGEMQDSELGPIPNGWRIGKLGEVANIKHGFAFKGEYFSEVETGTILLTPGNFRIGGGFNYSKFKYYDGEVPIEYVLNRGDLIVTMTDLSKEGDTLGYSALVPMIDGKMLLHNQRIGKVNSTLGNSWEFYLYFTMQQKDYRDYILSGATGTTVKHTSPTRIYDYRIALPSLNILQLFESTVSAVIVLMEHIQMQSVALATLRDALLPKLMSGEIEV